MLLRHEETIRKDSRTTRLGQRPYDYEGAAHHTAQGMTDLLIGYGEVGSALYDVLDERRQIVVHDPAKGRKAVVPDRPAYEWMHIAFPYTKSFIDDVLDYREKFFPRFIVIHSTVPVGTTRMICEKMGSHGNGDFGSLYVYYSPIRGLHPNLARYIREFSKWYASEWVGNADLVFAGYFAQAGIQVRRAPSTDMLELMKLWETLEYGYRIVLWQEIEREIRKNAPGDFDANLTAMKGWLFEKRKVYDGDRGLAPIMYGGIIGGHCVSQNWDLLRPQMTGELYNWLRTSNEMRREKK